MRLCDNNLTNSATIYIYMKYDTYDLYDINIYIQYKVGCISYKIVSTKGYACDEAGVARPQANLTRSASTKPLPLPAALSLKE